jgi:hypothetical protein
MDKNEAVREVVRAKGLALALTAAACTPEGTHMLAMEPDGKDGTALCSVVTEIYEKLSSVEQFLSQAGGE